jgi:hypothetical protein
MTKLQIINSTIQSHQEGFATRRRRQPDDLGQWNSQTRLTIKFQFSSHVRCDKMLEFHGRKDHEGKSSGSVLHGLVYAHECALLVNFRIHDTKKIPLDALGTLINTGTHTFLRPKCGKRLGYARYQIRLQGLEFEVGIKFLIKQLTSFLIRQKHQAY